MPSKGPRPISKTGRRRRATGWTLLALGLLVAAVWGASRWWYLSYWFTECGVSLAAGRAGFSVVERGAAPAGVRGGHFAHTGDRGGTARWIWTAEGEPLRVSVKRTSLWLAWRDHHDGSGSHYCVVLWPIPLLLWTPAALLLRSGILARRRAMKGSCAACGYSLAGLGAGFPCPECGKAQAEGTLI
jgi:hypothetical protein